MTDIDSGLMDKQTESELLSAIELGQLAFVSSERDLRNAKVDDLLDNLSVAAVPGAKATLEEDLEGENATRRLCYVDRIKGVSVDRRAEVIESVWSELGWPAKKPGVSTVMRWRKRCNGRADRVAALRDLHHRKGRTGPRHPPEIMTLMREVRDEHYLKKSPRITVKHAVRIVDTKVRLINATRPRSQQFRIPKRKAMLKVIGEVDAVEVIALRYGADAALMAMRTSLGGVKTSRPLERVEIDHTKLAIILLDDDFEPLGRASFTGAKDVNSRSVLGYYWGAEVPSVVALARCIRHAIYPKTEWLKQHPDIKNDWVCYGVFEVVAIDNGLEEFAPALRQAGSQLGIQTFEFSARKTPWHKPHIERYMAQQDQGLLRNLPGATMENIMTRTDFDPKKDVLMRASVFDRLLAKWVVDVYMQEPQAVLRGRSPTQSWIASRPNFTPYLPTETDLLDRLFLRQVDGRTLDHEGVEFDCLIYNSHDMRILRQKFGPKLKISIRVSDEDLGHIFVGVPHFDIWVKVPCLDQDYACGLTRWQHDKCKRMRRAFADDGVELSLAEARQQLLDDIEAEKTAVKQGRKLARQRMKEASVRGGGEQRPRQEFDAKPSHADSNCDMQFESEEVIPDFECEMLERGVA